MKTFLLALPLALAALFVSVAPASAHQPVPVVVLSAGHHHVHYDVLYRTCPRDPWVFYASFDCPDKAAHAARHLSHRGYEAFVRPHHHH